GGGHVDGAGDGLRRAGDPASGSQDVAGSQERLRRDAAVERTLPADQPLLHDGRGQAILHCAAGGVLTGWSGPDHDDVEVVSHLSHPPFETVHDRGRILRGARFVPANPTPCPRRPSRLRAPVWNAWATIPLTHVRVSATLTACQGATETTQDLQ